MYSVCIGGVVLCCVPHLLERLFFFLPFLNSHSMLYRTLHHPFLCTSSPHPHPQGMEPLKNDFLPEVEELWSVNGAGGTGDDLFVDEFLDFSNGASELEEQLPSPSPEEKKKALFVSPEKETPPPPLDIGGFDRKDDFGSLHGSELSVEAEGLESLEWLSHFVEDSFPDYSLAGKLVPPTTEKKFEPEAAPEPEQPCFVTPLQTKARTKRARTGVRVWPVLSHSPVESSSSSISSASSTTSFSPPNLWLSQAQPGEPKLAKKLKKKPAADGGGVVAAAQPRKCSHCGVTKTPQWRAGPLGSKTLCNACGVRFKSGRLLPEYRPACSPTFSSEIHSNNHRKVLEMRRKKEVETSDGGAAAALRSF